jgi:hypothetical protein
MLIEGLDIMLGPERQKVQLKEAPKEDEEGGVCAGLPGPGPHYPLAC